MNRFSRNSLLLLFTLLLFSCGEYQEVEFERIKELEVVSFDKGILKIKGTAVFFNPNKQGVKLTHAEIDIFHKDKKVANLLPAGKVRIKGRQTFEIPVNAEISMKDGGILRNVLGLINKRELLLEYRGYIRVRSWLVPHRIEISDSQVLKF